jgi:UDP-glucose 4-epimerase
MTDLKGKKVMVTGGAGFIGYHLCHKLSQLTDDLTIYDNLSSGKMENVKDNPKAKFVEGDILDVKKLCGQPKADLIYHLAAQVVVPYSMENPLIDFEINAKGTLCVLEKALHPAPQSTVTPRSCQPRKTTVSTRSHATAYPKWSGKNTARCTGNSTV